MRTTVDLPNELMRAAKMHAAQRGETLKDMFTRLVAAEVKAPARNAARGRVVLPLVGDTEGAPVEFSNEDIESVLADEDAERYGQ